MLGERRAAAAERANRAIAHAGREGGQVDDGVRQLCPRPLERSDSAEVRDPNLDGLISEFDYI